jgi:predicted HTH transcriptional regulator
MKNKDLLFKHLNKNYTKVPNKLFNMDPKFNSSCIGLYNLILSLPENFNPTLSYITNTLNISKNTARRHLQYLCDRCMIKKIRKGNFSNKEFDVYELRSMKDWK